MSKPLSNFYRKIGCFATVPIKMEIKKTYALSNCTFVGIMNIQTIQKNNSELMENCIYLRRNTNSLTMNSGSNIKSFEYTVVRPVIGLVTGITLVHIQEHCVLYPDSI